MAKARQIKKTDNRYLTKRDCLMKTSNYIDLMKVQETYVTEQQENYVEVYNCKEVKEDILNRFILDNFESLEISEEYFNNELMRISQEMSHNPIEFLEFDIQLQSYTDTADLYNFLKEKGFNFSFFDGLVSTKDFSVILEPNFEHVLPFDESLEDLLPFTFNWLKPEIIFGQRYKTGSDKIEDVYSYIEFKQTEELDYEEHVSEYINVPVNMSSKKGKRNKHKIKRNNYEELVNKRYLCSSPKNKFYEFLEEYTAKIILGQDLEIIVTHPNINKIIIKK